MASYGIKERPPTWRLDDDIQETLDEADGSTNASQSGIQQCSLTDDQQENQVDMFPDMMPTSPTRVMSTYGVTSITSASKAARKLKQKRQRSQDSASK